MAIEKLRKLLILALKEIQPDLRKEEFKIFNTLVKEVKGQFKLDIDSFHGINHWKRVRRIGLYIAERTGADTLIMSLFSVVHDSQRESEDL